MPKSITGGDTSGGSSSSTNTFTTLTAANIVNTISISSPQATIGILSATSGTIPTLSVGALTNTTNFTSPSATITSLTATTASIPSLTSTAATVGTLTNTTSFTSPSATITSITATTATIPALTSTTATVGTLTNTTSLTSPSATITSLSAPTLNSTTSNITNVNSTNITNTAAINTYDLTSTNLITGNNVTVTGSLTTASFAPQKIVTTTLNVGVAATEFSMGMSEYDATSIVYDPDTNAIGSSINDKRTSLSAIQYGSDLGISIDDNLAVATGLPNGINGAGAIDFPFGQTSYLLADTNSTASSNEMTICAAFKLLDTENAVSLVSYNNAQPSVNIAIGGNLFIERTGKYNLDTGITLTVGTNYILVITLSSTSGIKVRVNGVLLYTNTTSHGTYFFNTDIAFIGRHWLIDSQLQYFIGRLGNIMTAARLLTDTEIGNVEGYLSAKFQIAIGSIATIADILSDPFTVGSGTMKVYGGMTTTNLATSGTLSVTGTSTLTGNVAAAGNLNVVGEITTSNLSTSGTLAVNSTSSFVGDVTAAGNIVCAQNIQSYTLQSDKLTTRALYYEAAISVGVNSVNNYVMYYHNCGISYIPGSSNPTSNFTATIMNIPMDTTTTRVFTASLLYHQTTTANYCSSVAVSDTAGNFIAGSATTFVTPLFSGGTPSFTTKPNLVVQTFSVISIPDINGTMQQYVVSSVSPYY